MTFQDALDWQRFNAHHISRLSGLGDRLARRLIEAYHALHADKFNPQKQAEWHRIVEDYVRRELELASRRELQERFGHKIPKQMRRIDS